VFRFGLSRAYARCEVDHHLLTFLRTGPRMSSLTGESRFFSPDKATMLISGPSCPNPDNLPKLKAVIAGDNCRQFDLMWVPAMTATPSSRSSCTPAVPVS
jgi:hypothetical protein